MSDDLASSVLHEAHHCIALGDGAECTKDFELCIKTKDFEIREIMTPEEHRVVSALLQRAIGRGVAVSSKVEAEKP